MCSTRWNLTALVIGLALVGVTHAETLQAQPISPSQDGTGTLVNQMGNLFDIRGGKTSSDGKNLFHSFQNFGLDSNQIANFLSNPEIRNILGRVVGGEASLINGSIQITGGNSNLFLMNPAGIIFGPNASLNVPASFTATTATGIGFGGNQWFRAFGDNNYAALVGSPNAFSFALSQSGSLINAGNLAVGIGQSLTLIGGTVVNTGTLTAPEGQITLAAVPGENLVRISQNGMLLSLEVQPIGSQQSAINTFSTNLPLPPPSLPALLTGGNLGNATGLKVNPNGTVQLTGSTIQIPTTSGTVIAAGKFNVSGQVGGAVNVLGTQVGVLGATINASGVNGGGAVRVGGDYQGQGSVPNALHTVVDGTSAIKADAVSQGDGGRVILWSDSKTQFYGSISARGGVNGGNGGLVEVSGKNSLVFRGQADLGASKGTSGILLLDPVNITVVDGNGGADNTEITDNSVLFDDRPADSFTISEASLESLAPTANIVLEAANDITINDLTDNALNLQTKTGSITFRADADGSGVGSFSMNPGDTIRLQGGSINISGNSLSIGKIEVGNGGANSATGFLTSRSINLTGNEINLLGGAGSVRFVEEPLPSSFTTIGFREITMQSLTSGQAISIGGTTDSGAGTLDITREDLSAIQNAFDQLTVGSSGSAGNITVLANASPLQVGGPLTLQTGTGIITVQGRLEASSLSLQADEINLLGGSGSIRANAVSLRPWTFAQNTLVGGTTDTGTGTLDITAEDLAAFTPVGTRFSSLSISSGGSGTLTVLSPLEAESIRLQADEIDLLGGPGSIRTRAISLRPGSFAQNTLVGGATDTGPGILDITTSDLAALAPLSSRFSSLSIGAGGTGSLTVLSPLEADYVLFQANEIDLLSGPGSIRANSFALGSGTFPQNIIVGGAADTGTGTLDITTADLRAIVPLQNQFFFINIFGGSGTLTVQTPLTASSFLGLRSDEINLLSGPGSIRANTISLDTGTTNQNIVIGGEGDSAATSLDLTASDLSVLVPQGSFSSVEIGNSFNIGNITVVGGSPLTFGSSLALRTGGTIGLEQSLSVSQNLRFLGSRLEIGGDIAANGQIDLRGTAIVTRSTTISSSGTLSLMNSLTAVEGASITLAASNDLTAGDINANAGINLTSQSGAVIAGNLNSSGIASGGPIRISAKTQITTGTIDSSASVGNGGNVTLDPSGDIQVSLINAQGGTNGSGGNIDITTGRFFRATGTFADRNNVDASISTAGTNGGGSIIIRHAGGLQDTPFIVGDASINGTAGAITSGAANTILPRQSFVGPYTQGNIQIITTAPRKPPQEVSPLPINAQEFNTTTVGDAQNTLKEIEKSTGIKPALIYVRFRPIPAGCVGRTLAECNQSIETITLKTLESELKSISGNAYSEVSEKKHLRQQEQSSLPVTLRAASSLLDKPNSEKPETRNTITLPNGKQQSVINVALDSKSYPVQYQSPAYQLELVVVTSTNKPYFERVDITREEVKKAAKDFISQVSKPYSKDPEQFREPARKLYKWLVGSIKPQIDEHKIQNLVFILEPELGTLPLAALYDGNQYLIEKYSVGLIPSLTFTNTNYIDITKARVLAMGTSFEKELPQSQGYRSLPYVPQQLSFIEKISGQKVFRDQDFTPITLESQQSEQRSGIVQISSHARFNPNDLADSSIAFWQKSITFEEFRNLKLKSPELLILGACETARGSEETDLGFAGLAYKTGAKTVLASIWEANQVSTLAFLNQFYVEWFNSRKEGKPLIKAELIRKAQEAMLKGDVKIDKDGQSLHLKNPPPGMVKEIQLPSTIKDVDLTQPRHWAAFTLVGSPW